MRLGVMCVISNVDSGDSCYVCAYARQGGEAAWLRRHERPGLSQSSHLLERLPGAPPPAETTQLPSL